MILYFLVAVDKRNIEKIFGDVTAKITVFSTPLVWKTHFNIILNNHDTTLMFSHGDITCLTDKSKERRVRCESSEFATDTGNLFGFVLDGSC